MITQGEPGETYNIGGHNEKQNIEVVHSLCHILNQLAPEHAPQGGYQTLITHVADRPGHDRRYAIDSSKMQNQLGWTPEETFESGMRKTVEWYLNNEQWWQRVLNGEYQLARLGSSNHVVELRA